jgi:hypothetical protein
MAGKTFICVKIEGVTFDGVRNERRLIRVTPSSTDVIGNLAGAVLFMP